MMLGASRSASLRTAQACRELLVATTTNCNPSAPVIRSTTIGTTRRFYQQVVLPSTTAATGTLPLSSRKSATTAVVSTCPSTFRLDADKKVHQFTSTAASTPSTNSSTIPSNIDVQLYQYAICPFCNRVKALLDYAGVPYQTTEVNPLTKAEIKPWKDQHKQVPIATIDEAPVFESDYIIERLLEQPTIQKALENRWRDNGQTMTLKDFQSGPTVKQWKTFASNELAVLLYPNMCRSWGDSYQAFDYVNLPSSPFGPLQRILIQTVGSLAMYLAAAKVKKRRGITDERQALDDVLVVLEKELQKDQQALFLSGRPEPNLGDLYVYGTLRAIQGLPVYESLVSERGGALVDWCDRMAKQLERTSSG